MVHYENYRSCITFGVDFRIVRFDSMAKHIGRVVKEPRTIDIMHKEDAREMTM